MTLTVELTPEEQDRLAARATARGISIDELIHDALIHGVLHDATAVDASGDVFQEAAALPAWRGTVIASLSRKDIYGDAG